ncbi:MAG: BON domain-containing protein [Syntrophales bacterium]|jgi:hyperosmotically inducible periplasmic protein
MKKVIIAVIVCAAMVSLAYGQDVKDITSAAKEGATGVAKEQAIVVADDAAITAEVKAQLYRIAALRNKIIEVSTTDGVVTLKGKVNHQQQHQWAAKTAKSVKGVKSVDNQIEVVPQAPTQ